jgi:rhamnopyranosyl-N-acetylglucosaminyl-diphospho-decaprenol beta-1,3/1,4-galactofuranosyltransferase
MLRECLMSLLRQIYKVDMICIVDNDSEDGTEQLCREEFDGIPNVIYRNIAGGNVGPAACVFEGLDFAYQKSFDWVWIMDDDAEPPADALEKLMYFGVSKEIGAVGCLVHGKSDIIQAHHHLVVNSLLREKRVFDTVSRQEVEKMPPVRVDVTSFVGLLISRKALDVVGLNRKDYFMYQDDKEFTYRVSRHLPVYILPSAPILHKDDSNKQGHRLKTEVFWRVYYGFRNSILFRRDISLILAVFYGLYGVVRSVAGIYYYNDEFKCLRMKCVIRGFIDGLLGISGKRIDPKEYQNLVKKRVARYM